MKLCTIKHSQSHYLGRHRPVVVLVFGHVWLSDSQHASRPVDKGTGTNSVRSLLDRFQTRSLSETSAVSAIATLIMMKLSLDCLSSGSLRLDTQPTLIVVRHPHLISRLVQARLLVGGGEDRNGEVVSADCVQIVNGQDVPRDSVMPSVTKRNVDT